MNIQLLVYVQYSKVNINYLKHKLKTKETNLVILDELRAQEGYVFKNVKRLYIKKNYSSSEMQLVRCPVDQSIG